MLAFRRADLNMGWLPTHQDQLRAQRLVTNMEELYLYLLTWLSKVNLIHGVTNSREDGDKNRDHHDIG